MIQKRTTYEFIMFVNGRYNIEESHELLNMFNHMSYDEKEIIMSMNFSFIWYHAFRNGSNTARYSSLNLKFRNLATKNGGSYLRELINKSTCVDKLWECPKGKVNGRETPLKGAIREFYEESGMSKCMYRLTECKVKISYISVGTNYITTYYVAIYNGAGQAHLRMGPAYSQYEIGGINWIPLRSLNAYNIRTELKNAIARAKRFVKKNYYINVPYTPICKPRASKYTISNKTSSDSDSSVWRRAGNRTKGSSAAGAKTGAWRQESKAS